jgi:hypothetical protein
VFAMADVIELEYTATRDGHLCMKFLGELGQLRREQFFERLARGPGIVDVKRSGERGDELLLEFGYVERVRQTADGNGFDIEAKNHWEYRKLRESHCLPLARLVNPTGAERFIRCPSKISSPQWRRILDREHLANHSGPSRGPTRLEFVPGPTSGPTSEELVQGPKGPKKSKSRWWKCWQ